MAAQAGRPGQRLADQGKAGVAHAGGPAAPEAPRVGRDQDGQEPEEEKQAGPQEVHQGRRPSQRSENRLPTTRIRMLAPAKSAVISIFCGFDDQPRVEVVVDRAELLRVLRPEVRALGHGRDLLEQRLVELRVDLEAVEVQGRPRRASEADGEDPDPLVGGGLRRGRRVRRLVVLAVGEQDDDRRRVRPGRHGRGRGRGRRRGRAVAVVVLGRRRFGEGDRPQGREDAPGRATCRAPAPGG